MWPFSAIDFFFILIILSQIYQVVLEKKLILVVYLVLATAAILILDQPEFYHSKALQARHAACEIWEPWVQWFQRNGLKRQSGRKFCKGWRKFSNCHCDLILYFCFYFDISHYQGPTYTQDRISAKYTKPFWRNGLKCQGRRKFSNGYYNIILI